MTVPMITTPNITAPSAAEHPTTQYACAGGAAVPASAFYKRHMFFCLNQRDDGQPCCAEHDAAAMLEHCKTRLKALGLHGQGKVRANRAGCLGRCDVGPTVVVYPEGVWYTWLDKDDIDEIIDSHIVQGRVVQRLLLA